MCTFQFKEREGVQATCNDGLALTGLSRGRLPGGVEERPLKCIPLEPPEGMAAQFGPVRAQVETSTTLPLIYLPLIKTDEGIDEAAAKVDEVQQHDVDLTVESDHLGGGVIQIAHQQRSLRGSARPR